MLKKALLSAFALVLSLLAIGYIGGNQEQDNNANIDLKVFLAPTTKGCDALFWLQASKGFYRIFQIVPSILPYNQELYTIVIDANTSITKRFLFTDSMDVNPCVNISNEFQVNKTKFTVTNVPLYTSKDAVVKWDKSNWRLEATGDAKSIHIGSKEAKVFVSYGTRLDNKYSTYSSQEVVFENNQSKEMDYSIFKGPVQFSDITHLTVIIYDEKEFSAIEVSDVQK